MSKPRLRDLGIPIGTLPTGPLNAITDVPEIWVGHKTLIYDEPRIARTGVTVILPREGRVWTEPVFAGFHSYNGCGEMTGTHWVEESGMLTTPIAITNTGQVGTVHEAIGAYAVAKGLTDEFELPVIAETYDGRLNDMNARHIKDAHVFEAMDSASSGPVAEGAVGGGTGMICHEFKGGIGTSSRVVEIFGEAYHVGVLVQANYGLRPDLRVDGVPLGADIGTDLIPSPWGEPDPPNKGDGSIIIIIATDAPLLPFQCKRLAQRGVTGLARTGGFGHNGSGDIFLAFSTGNQIIRGANGLIPTHFVPNEKMNRLFHAVSDAVEESILNALVAAETTTGFMGQTAYALPQEELLRVWKKYRE